MEQGKLCIRMVIFMRDNGLMGKSMVMVNYLKNRLKDIMMGSGKITRGMALVFLSYQIISTILALLYLQLNMVLELRNSRMVINTGANILKESFMGRENISGKMEHFIKENFSMVKEMVLEYGDRE